jgi:hypothetical protein
MVLFGSTLTPAQTLLLSPANVKATTQQIVEALAAAVGTGALPIERLDDALTHILTVKGVDVCARPRN